MTPQDLSVSRRALDIEDFIDILRRHKAWIFGPTFAALVIAVVVAFLWPDTYVSSGIIRVVPPQVPESYVPNNLNTDMQGRINQITQVILNRPTLTALVMSYDLYKKERGRLPIDDVIDNMRSHDIHIGAVQTFGQMGERKVVPAFSVSFAYTNRHLAQTVARDLISKFLVENQNEQTQGSVGTTQFLQQQRDEAKRKLDEIEQRLSNFRTLNLGRLPEQQTTNFQQINAVEAQIVNMNTSMSGVSQEKLLLENQLRSYKETLTALKDPSMDVQVVLQKNEKLAEKDREIQAYENALASSRERYRETHPDVQSLAAKLATLKKQRDTITKEDANKKVDPATPRQPSPEYIAKQHDLEVAIQRVQAMIDAKDLQMEDYRKQLVSLNNAMKLLQERMQGMPTGTKDYEALLREQDIAKREFEDREKKLDASGMATAVINRQQGEKLELLEEANVPATPTEPKRPVIVLAGTGLGLVIGLILAGVREVKNTALKNLKDVRAYTQLPVLGSIPLLENDLVVRRRRRLAWLAWSTACLVGIVIMSSSVVYYFATKV